MNTETDPPADPYASAEAEPESNTTDDAAPNGSLKKKVINATYWSLGGQVLIQALRMVQNIVLAKLLFPEAFGAAELVMTVMVGLEMISDLGIEPSIVHHARGEERRFLHTAFTIQAIRGVILFVLALASTPLVVWLANESTVDVASLVPLAAGTALLFGFMPMKVWLLHRHLDAKRIAIIEVLSFVAAMLTMIILASMFPRAWVLILGGVVRVLVRVLMIIFWLEGPMDRLDWEPEAARDIINFGKWIFLSTLITFLAERMTIFALPRLTDLGVLGVFSQGNKFAALTSVVAGPVVGQVMMPALAEAARNNHESLVSGFRTSRETILRALTFVTLGLALGVPVLIRVAFDERYADAGWMTQLSLVSAWFNFLTFSWGRAVLAIGNSRPLPIMNAVKLVATFGCVVGGFHLFGVPGLLLGSGIGSLMGHLVILIALQMNRLPAWGLDIKYGALTLALGLVGGLLPYAIGPAFGQHGFIIVQTILAVVICVPLGLWTLKDTLGHLRSGH